MSAMALFAAQRGIETGLAMKGAFDSQQLALQQSANLEMQMEEIQTRTNMQIQNIYQKSEKVVAAQEAAFTKAGVQISGSAMSVISDTLNDAAKSAYIRQRETDYDLMGISMDKAHYDRMGSTETLLLNLGAAGLKGYAGHKKDQFNYARKSIRNIGAAGLGVDEAGGTTQYSRDYLNS